MEQVKVLSESELKYLENSMIDALKLLKRKSLKKNFVILGKAMLSTVFIAGGVAVAIVFPSPITLALLGVAAALVGGNRGLLKDVKSVKRKNGIRKTGKEELKVLKGELVARKEVPSAPPKYAEYEPNSVYPDLSAY